MIAGNLLDAASILLISAGAIFFCAGTIGLLRMPDERSQMHALAKADNIGLGLLLLGLAPQLGSLGGAVLLMLIWLLALLASSLSAQLLGGIVAEREEGPA